MGGIIAVSEEPPLLGDTNSDGKINTTDARAVLLYVVGRTMKDDFFPEAADANEDGKINTTDARLLLQFGSGPLLPDFQ